MTTTAALTTTDLAQYDRNGYLEGRATFSRDETAEVRRIFEALIASHASGANRRIRDVGAIDGLKAGSQQPEIDRATLLAPELLETAVYRKSKSIADALLGRRTRYVFDHIIAKMPGTKTETAWHQDRGYLLDNVELQTVNFWVPLQDVDESNGTLGYVPGSHKGALLRHGRDPALHPHVKTISMEGLTPVYCRLKEGDYCVHHPMTIHGAGPNLTDRPRLAWSLHFGPLGRLEYLRPGNLVPVLKRVVGIKS